MMMMMMMMMVLTEREIETATLDCTGIRVSQLNFLPYVSYQSYQKPEIFDRTLKIYFEVVELIALP